MKKLLFLGLLAVTMSSIAQTTTTTTTTTKDGKTVVVKSETTQVNEKINNQNDSDCNLGPDFVEGKTSEKLRKHVMVDNACEKKDIIFINMQDSRGRGIYVLCVKGKLMKYKKIGTVFMRDGDNPFEN